MAKIIRDDEEVLVENGESIVDACKQLRVSFGCKSGLCGTCNIIVEEGMDNLSKRTEAEDEMGLPENNRLACQCKISGGTVKFRY